LDDVAGKQDNGLTKDRVTAKLHNVSNHLQVLSFQDTIFFLQESG
jgi:hypothetical protein